MFRHSNIGDSRFLLGNIQKIYFLELKSVDEVYKSMGASGKADSRGKREASGLR